MTTPSEIDRIKAIADTLDPAAVSAEVSLMTGARLKSQNLDNVGARSAETGVPGFDKIDRWARGKHKAYRSAISRALKALEDATFIQAQLLVRLCDEHGNPNDEARALAAEAVSPQADECANCHRVVERTASDRLRGGRCLACYKYLQKHGVERPESLWILEMAA